MTIPFYIIDVFAEKKYAGNQLAVFLHAADLTTDQMQQIAREINFAESTFITRLDLENNVAEIRIFTPEHEMKFAGHPIIGTSWVLMNKVFSNQLTEITLSVPIGDIPVHQAGDLIWLQAAQPKFFDAFLVEDFFVFSNLRAPDFDQNFPIQEVSTGSAFVIIPISTKKALENLALDLILMNEWLIRHCKTDHRALYFYCFDEKKLITRMFCIENNQLIEDAATGSASTCLQAFLLKYYSSEIQTINHQGDFMNRSSQIYFDGKVTKNYFDIKIGGKTQFIAKGEWEV